MPHGKRKKTYSKKNRRRYNKSNKGLSKKEKRQVAVIAQKAVVNLGDPKRSVFAAGEFHTDVQFFSYGSPKYIDGDDLGGMKTTSETRAIAVGRVSKGSDPNSQRKGNKILLKGMAFNFMIGWNPHTINENCIVRLALISTMNDPSGGDLGYIPGATPQDARNHIPSLLMPPADTMGLRYKDSATNRVWPGLDPSEYQFHWSKRFSLNQTDTITWKSKQVKVVNMLTTPAEQEYIGASENTILGRRYFILYNSNAPESTATLAEQDCPAIHFRIWTYFRDRNATA